MGCELVAITLDATDPERHAAFWSALLDRPVEPHADGLLLPGPDAEVGLRTQHTVRAVPPGRHRTHLHLTSQSAEDQDARVSRALDLGARPLDVGQRPDEGHVVLADPEGHELCVLPPGGTFLAGCGLLAEVACDGLREVGLFWRDALGWALVWDEDGETAVQSPEGGTKVAWGGAPVAAKAGRNPQRPDLVTADLEGEVERLTGLGARVLARGDDLVELADPGGDELTLRRGEPRAPSGG